jgi:hypothetical protein
MLFGYVILWLNEIRAAFEANPLWMSLGLVGIVGCLVYVFAARQKSDTSQTSDIQIPPTYVAPRRKHSIARRIFAWFVIAWRVAGLVGAVVAIVRRITLR